MRIKGIILTCVIILMSHYNSVHGQGGVDVEFVPIDSITSQFINREVKLDFTSSDTTFSIIKRRLTRDTVKLLIDNRLTDFVENKGRGVDYYYFKEEYLESESYVPGQVVRIYKCVVKEILSDSILFNLTLQVYEKCKRKEYEKNEYSLNNKNIKIYSPNEEARYFCSVESEIRDLWIQKRRLDGLLIRTW